MNYYGRDRSTQIRVGIMTVMTVVILFFGYSWLRDWYGRSRYKEIQVMFTNAGSLEVGNSVTVFGVKRGRVTDISLDEKGVLVTMRLDIDFRLPLDTQFVIRDSNLMGGRQLDIIPGKSTMYIEKGIIPQGESHGSLSSLLPKIETVMDDLHAMISKFTGEDELPSKIIDTVNRTHSITTKIDDTLEYNRKNLEAAIKNFHETSKQLNVLLADNKENVSNALTGAADSMGKLDKSLDRLDKMLETLEPLVEAAGEDESTVYRLLTEEDFYTRLITVTGKVDSLLTDIKENPRRYFKFSIF